MMHDPQPSSITAVHSGALGDVILLGRLLEILARRRGQAAIKLVAGHSKAMLLKSLGVVSQAVSFDTLPMEEVFSDKPLTQCRLAGLLGQCDTLVSCLGHGDDKAQLRLAALTGADNAAFLPIRPPGEYGGHLVELWCDMLGLDFPKSFAPWPVPEQWASAARDALAAAGIDVRAPYAVIHPGSGGLAKCWPLDNFIALADRLKQASHSPARQTLFVFGPVEAETWPAGALARLAGRCVLNCPQLDVLAGVLSASALYVGNDSGPSHLAAAVGAKTLAVFSASNRDHFAPLGPAATPCDASTPIADCLP